MLVPARAALKGLFPLNGTYFQVNEVFLADDGLQDIPMVRSLHNILITHGR